MIQEIIKFNTACDNIIETIGNVLIEILTKKNLWIIAEALFNLLFIGIAIASVLIILVIICNKIARWEEKNDKEEYKKEIK